MRSELSLTLCKADCYNGLYVFARDGRRMITIGLSGGIGSGKTEASRILQEMGAEVIIADQVGHQAYEPHTDAWKQVVETFGEDILQPDGQIDRRKLGGIVFSNPEEMAKLNAIMHPRMHAMMEERLRELEAKGAQVAVLEAAILIEAGWISLVDEAWMLEVPEEVAVERIHQRNGLAEEEIRKRLRSQLSNEERAKHASEVIENTGDLEALRLRLEELWYSRLQGRHS